MKDREIDDIIPFEERMNSLRPNREKRITESLRRNPPDMKIIDESAYKIFLEKIAPDTPEVRAIKTINENLETKLALFQNTEEAFATIYELEDSRKIESVALDRVLSEIDKRIIDDGSGWKKKIVIGGTKALWIVARKVLPQFQTADEVINNIEKGNWEKAVVGMIKIMIPGGGIPIQCFSWLIKELREQPD